MRARSSIISLSLLACLTVACGDDKAEAGEAGTEGAAAEAGEAAEGDGGGEAQPEAQPKAGPSPVTGADRFKHWSPRHAFINTPVILGDVISASEAIVATAGGHVGVTTDGGASWQVLGSVGGLIGSAIGLAICFPFRERQAP